MYYIMPQKINMLIPARNANYSNSLIMTRPTTSNRRVNMPSSVSLGLGNMSQIFISRGASCG